MMRSLTLSITDYLPLRILDPSINESSDISASPENFLPPLTENMNNVLANPIHHRVITREHRGDRVLDELRLDVNDNTLCCISKR